MAHICIAPACPGACMGCNHAISAEMAMAYAKRYAWLRTQREFHAMNQTQDAMWHCDMPADELDAEIDAAMLPVA